jgi:hypothetical protein
VCDRIVDVDVDVDLNGDGDVNGESVAIAVNDRDNDNVNDNDNDNDHEVGGAKSSRIPDGVDGKPEPSGEGPPESRVQRGRGSGAVRHGSRKPGARQRK